LAKLSSTTFDSQLEVAEPGRGRKPHLYFEIQSLNDYGGESLPLAAGGGAIWLPPWKSGNAAGFTAPANRGRAYWMFGRRRVRADRDFGDGGHG
jgi:chorismate mutase/prephenate dehydrogenase